MANDTMQFDDIPLEHDAGACIHAVVRAGIVSPLSMNPPRFGPDYAVTRAQLAVYLARAMALQPREVAEATFADVPSSHWAHGFVEALYAQKIITGAAAGPLRFMPDEAVTRAVIAAVLCRAKGLDPLVRDEPTFADVPRDHWAFGWIERLADPNSWGGTAVSRGCDPGPPLQFCPEQVVTRALLAVFLCRALGINTD
jgi:hypothetical protein